MTKTKSNKESTVINNSKSSKESHKIHNSNEELWNSNINYEKQYKVLFSPDTKHVDVSNEKQNINKNNDEYGIEEMAALFDNDMVEEFREENNPTKNIKEKIPWVDKYRAKQLKDIIHQDEVIKILKQCLVTKQFTHMIFYGPPGTGKCLGYDTPVLQYDGSIKMVQNIKLGDYLMGDDNTKRKVLSTTEGFGAMYKISYKYGSYVVNSDHILCLKLITPSIMSKRKSKFIFEWFENFELCIASFDSEIELLEYKKNKYVVGKVNAQNDVCEISVKDYLQKTNTWKKSFFGYKTDAIVCWKKKQVNIDPYRAGQM